MQLLSNFSETLKELIFEYDSNISVDKFAGLSDIPQQSLSNWITGNNIIKRTQLIKIIEFFNCSVEYMLRRTDIKLAYTPHPCPSFHERLRSVLHECGKTTYSLVTQTRYKSNFLYKWKNGADPRLDTLIELSDFLGCTVDYLIGREN